MNVLVGILKYPPDYAGDGLRLHRTFQRLRQKGGVGEVFVLTSWDQKAATQNEVRDGIFIMRPIECTLKPKFRKLRKKLILFFDALKVIATFFRFAPKIDLVLTAGSGWFPSLIAWLAFFARKPLVKEIVLLGSDDPETINRCKSFWVKWFFLSPFKFAQLIIAISPALETACLACGIPPNKIWCRLNAVDYALDPAHIHERSYDIPVILWVGSITPRKNVEFLMQAARYLIQPAKVWFVGPCSDKKYLNELQELQKKVPRHVQVEFLGHIENPKKLIETYLRADLFWFASKKEGMANVVAEALFCGTPVVTLPVMGIMKQVMRNGKDGEIVDTSDPKEFALVASRWLEKEIDRAEISKHARRQFDAVKVDAQYILHFEKITGQKQAERRFAAHKQPAPV